MSVSPQPIRQEELAELTERALTFYDEQLKTILEPGANGKVVAIDAVSGDYAVADTSPAAMRLMHERRPEALLVFRTIGAETRRGLVARVLGAGPRAEPHP